MALCQETSLCSDWRLALWCPPSEMVQCQWWWLTLLLPGLVFVVQEDVGGAG